MEWAGLSGLSGCPGLGSAIVGPSLKNKPQSSKAHVLDLGLEVPLVAKSDFDSAF